MILFAHGYWVIGSLIGAVLGASIPFDLHFLAFSLTALFVVLAVELCFINKRYMTLSIAMLAVVLSLLVFPSQMLIAALGIAALLMLLVYPWRKDCDD